MRVNGDAMIFRNERQGMRGVFYTYTAGISGKDKEGNYVNTYMDVMFRSGVVLDNKTKIDIKDGFLSVKEYTVWDKEENREKKVKSPYIMVLDFVPLDGGAGHTGSAEGFTALSEDVPF